MTRARELARLGNTSALTVDNSQNIGIGSLTPDVKLDVIGDAEISGVITATSFSGSGSALTGVASTDNIITGTAATFTGGVWVGSALTTSGITTVYNNTESTAINDGALVISGGVGIAKSLNVGGNVTVGGTLTYEDVTNVDVLGIATYRQSLYVGSTEGSGAGAGVSMHSNGNAIFAGITTVTNFDATGTLVEAFSSTTTAYSSAGDLNISNGNVQFSSANLAGTNNTLNIISTTGINTDLAEGQTLTVTAISAVNASTAYVNRINVDGVATGITTHWVGGEIPSEGGGSGVDLYTFNLLKTGSSTYIIVANHSKTSS